MKKLLKEAFLAGQKNKMKPFSSDLSEEDCPGFEEWYSKIWKEEKSILKNGWVIINFDHPNNPKSKLIYPETFYETRKGCIKRFIDGTRDSWRWWRRKYNFRVVKATSEITITQDLMGYGE